jgi:hypothetical protein
LKSSGSCLENREYGLGILHADHVAPSIRKKLAITSPTCGGRSVGIVRSRTQTMEFFITRSKRKVRQYIKEGVTKLFHIRPIHHPKSDATYPGKASVRGEETNT